MSGIMLGTWRLCYLSVLPVARLQNPSCWDSHFTPDVCCNLAFGPHGNAECWDGVHTFEFCCGSSAAVPTAREPASPECWSAGYSEGDCCDLLHGPHGNPACWSGGQEHGYTFAKCCASHEAGQVATFGEQGPPAAPRFGADCWHGLWESFFFCCEPASGFQFCKISPSKYDRCCNGLYRAPPIWFHVSKDEPMARCWLHLVHDQYHLNLQSPRECHKANSQQYYVSAVLLRKMLVNFSHKPWWARPRGEHYSDAENRESEPQLPIHWMYMGSVCVPSVCDEDMVAGWFAVKLDPIGDHKIAQGRAINSTHLEVPPLVAIRRPYVHFDRAWIAIRSSANRHFIDTEYCEFTMFKYNAAWSLSLSQGHRKIICTWVIIVMFASVCHFLPFSRYLGFLAPQRSVLQLYRRHGAIWLDVVRVLLCIKVIGIHVADHYPWRGEGDKMFLWFFSFFMDYVETNHAFVVLMVYLSTRHNSHKKQPEGFSACALCLIKYVARRWAALAPVLAFWLYVYVGVFMEDVPLHNAARSHFLNLWFLWKRQICLIPGHLWPTLLMLHNAVHLEGSPCHNHYVYENFWLVDVCTFSLFTFCSRRTLGPAVATIWIMHARRPLFYDPQWVLPSGLQALALAYALPSWLPASKHLEIFLGVFCLSLGAYCQRYVEEGAIHFSVKVIPSTVGMLICFHTIEEISNRIRGRAVDVGGIRQRIGHIMRVLLNALARLTFGINVAHFFVIQAHIGLHEGDDLTDEGAGLPRAGMQLLFLTACIFVISVPLALLVFVFVEGPASSLFQDVASATAKARWRF